jgi:NADPH:quinone reductase-like Zn-dependent oxidoreductase
MRRVVVHAFGGPEQLIVQSVPDWPRPGPGQILIDVEAPA